MEYFILFSDATTAGAASPPALDLVSIAVEVAHG
jgi:hypothetical protein